MSNNPISISIIIPAWNTAAYLHSCLDSILKQSYRKIEVIAIDDASTDETGKILQHYQNQDSRVSICTCPYNQGPGKCRNIGIEQAKGEYILFVDSDDLLTEGCLEFLMENMKKDIDICLFNGSSFNHQNKFIIHNKYIPLEKNFFENGKIKQEYVYPLYSCHTPCMKLYKRNFILSYQIRFPEFIYGEDVEFWMRCLCHTEKIEYIPYMGYMRRYRPNSIMTSGSKKNIMDRINNLDSLLNLAQSRKWMNHYITHSYIRSIALEIIEMDTNLCHPFSIALKNLSGKYHLNIAPDLITVILPVHEPKDLLSRTLRSILCQTHFNLEILIINDNLNSAVENTVKSIKDSRIRYHQLPLNNRNAILNQGIRLAHGKYVAILDPNSLWRPEHLSSCMKLLKDTGADGVYGLGIPENMAQNEKALSLHSPQENEKMINYLLRTGYDIQDSTLFTTSESIKKVEWDETLNYYQTYDFLIRYSKKYKFALKNTPTVICHSPGCQPEIEFESCIRLIDSNKEYIEPHLYSLYNRNMLKLAFQQNASEKIINHYRQESIRHIEYLSFIQFLSLHHPQTLQEAEELRQGYIKQISETE